jgi:opacity protein-like surface antigen
MMKTLMIAAASVAALAAASAASAQEAPRSGYYVRGDVGGTFSGKIDGAGGPQLDSGWAISGGAGRDFGNGLRLEGQALYLNSANKNSLGNTQLLGGFANAYYDIIRTGPIQPFVGVGIGIAQVKLDGDRAPLRGDDTGLAYQFQAGVAHPFNDRLIGEVAYRYIGVTDVKIGSGVGAINGDYNTSAVTVGLRYAF